MWASEYTTKNSPSLEREDRAGKQNNSKLNKIENCLKIEKKEYLWVLEKCLFPHNPGGSIGCGRLTLHPFNQLDNFVN